MSQSITDSNQFERGIEPDGLAVPQDAQSSKQMSTNTHRLEGFPRHVERQDDGLRVPASSNDGADISILDDNQQSQNQLHSERVWQESGQDSMQGAGHVQAKSTVDVAPERVLKDPLPEEVDDGAAIQAQSEKHEEWVAEVGHDVSGLDQNENQMKTEDGGNSCDASSPVAQEIEQDKQDQEEEREKNEQDENKSAAVPQTTCEPERNPAREARTQVEDVRGPPEIAVIQEEQEEVLEEDEDGTNDEIVEYEAEAQAKSQESNQGQSRAQSRTGKSDTLDRATDQNLELEETDPQNATLFQLQADEQQRMEAVQLDFSQQGQRPPNTLTSARRSPGQSVKVVSRRSTRRGSGLVVDTTREDQMKQIELKMAEAVVTPLEHSEKKLGTENNESLSWKKSRKQSTMSPKKRASPSMRSEQSIQEIMSADSLKFRRAIEGKISGMLEIELRKSQAKRDNQQFQNFLSRDVISQTSSEDEDDYSPIKLQKHIPASNLFKDLLKQKMDAKDFDWSGHQDYFQFHEDERYELMNTPVQRGKALWAFIFNAMRQKPRFEKMKQVICKFNSQPETQERIDRRRALEDYLKTQAKKIQGDAHGQLEETQGKSMNEQLVTSMYEGEQSQLAQAWTFQQLEDMKVQMDKLQKMHHTGEQAFSSLKKVIGFKHPKEKILEQIQQVRQEEALNKLQRAVAKMQTKKLETTSSPKKEVKAYDKALLRRQEQLIKLQERAKPKVDQKWESNPFKSYRQQQKEQGVDTSKVNWVARNIGRYSRRRNSRHAAHTLQYEENDRQFMVLQDTRNSRLNSSATRQEAFLKTSHLVLDRHGKQRESLPSTDILYASFARGPSDVKSDDELKARAMCNESQHGSQLSKDMLLKISQKSQSPPKKTESQHLPDIGPQNNAGPRTKAVTAVDMARLLNALQEQHGVEPDDLPLEIIRLLIERFEFYQTKIHQQMDTFKDKLHRIREKEIKKKREQERKRLLNAEPDEEVAAANLDQNLQMAPNTGETSLQQLDDTHLRSSPQQFGSNTHRTQSVTYDLAQYLVANIEMLSASRRARRLKAELHILVQRFLTIRSLIQNLNGTIMDNHRIHEEDGRNKATTVLNSSSLRQSTSRIESQNPIKAFIMSKQVEVEAEKVKIFFDPQVSLNARMTKQHERSTSEDRVKRRMSELALCQEITNMVYPTLRTLIRYSAKKVQYDFSFRMILMRKLIKIYESLKSLDRPRDSEHLFRIQENDAIQSPTTEALIDEPARQSGVFSDVQHANLDGNVPASAAEERCLESRDEQKKGEDPWQNQHIFTSFNVESSQGGWRKQDHPEPQPVAQRQLIKSAQNARTYHAKKKPERIELHRINQVHSNNIFDTTNFSTKRGGPSTSQGPRQQVTTAFTNKPELHMRERSQPDGSTLFMKKRIRRGNRRYDRAVTNSMLVNNEDNSLSVLAPQHQRGLTNSQICTIDAQRLRKKIGTPAETCTGTNTAEQTMVLSPTSAHGSQMLSKNIRKKVNKYMQKQSRDDGHRRSKPNPDTIFAHFLKSPAGPRSSLRIGTRPNFGALLEQQVPLTTKHKTLHQAEIYKPVQAQNYCAFGTNKARDSRRPDSLGNL